jgi:hypothetical protein
VTDPEPPSQSDLPPGLPDPRHFLSPQSGLVAGVRLTTTRRLADLALDVRDRMRRRGRRLDALVHRLPRRRVLILSVYRPDSLAIEPAVRELRGTRHDLLVALGSMGDPRRGLQELTLASGLRGGKFQNLNAIHELTDGAGGAPDWTLVIDDDVVLPPRFLDRFIALCDAFGLTLAQPAQTRRSHAAWPVTRRRGGSLLRETRFVEIGPVTAFAREAASLLIPFPDLRYGWGLDSHWAAVALERGWRMGVADAVPVRHEQRPVATAYRHADAVTEARRFLADRPYLALDEADLTVATHRRVPV